MKRMLFPRLMLIALIASIPYPAVGQSNQANLKADELRAYVAKAKAKKLRVTVRLKSGATVKGDLQAGKDGSISGEVAHVYATDFTISDIGHSGWHSATIDYVNIEAINRESQMVKVFKKIGEYSLITAAAVIIMPLLIIEGLLGIAPDC